MLNVLQNGSTPLAINQSIADAPAGEGTSTVPLLSSSSSLLSPASADPAGINISSSSYTTHVMESQRHGVPWHWALIHSLSVCRYRHSMQSFPASSAGSRYATFALPE